MPPVPASTKPFLIHLNRAEVAELTLASGARPTVRVGREARELESRPLERDEVLHLLVALGGSRHLETLAAKPAQWRTRVEGVGAMVTVNAEQRGVVLEARLWVKDPPAGANVTVAPAVAAITMPPAAGPRIADSRRDDSEPPPPLGGARPPMRRSASSPAMLAQARARVFDEAPREPTPRPREVEARAPESPRPKRDSRPPKDGAPREKRRTNPRVQSPLGDDPRNRPTSPGMKPARPAEPPPLADEWVKLPELAPLPPPVGSLAAAPAPVVSPPPPPPAASIPPAATPVVATTLVSSSAPPRSLPVAEARPTRPPVTARPQGQGAGPGAARWKDLLAAARDAQASDLHLVAGRPVGMRVVGTVDYEGPELTAAQMDELLDGRLSDAERGALARDGATSFTLSDPLLGRFRGEVTRDREGPRIALRVQPSEAVSLPELQLPEALALPVKELWGLYLVTAPPGQGKSAVAAAMVDRVIREAACHVVVVEEASVYAHPRRKGLVSQREVGTHTPSVAAGVEAALLEDPDVVVIDPLEDAAGARAAMAAVEAGYLVVATMSAGSAQKAIDRLLSWLATGDSRGARDDAREGRQAVAGSLRLATSHRLVPSRGNEQLIPVLEILPGGPATSALIREGRTAQIPAHEQKHRGAGAVRLEEALAELVKQKTITHAAGLHAADSPDDLEAILAGAATLSASGSSIPTLDRHSPTPSAPTPAAPEPAPSGRGLLGSLFSKRGS